MHVLSRAPKFGHLMTPFAMSANCDVILGNWVKTSLQTRSHRRRNWTKLFSLQYIQDYSKLSETVANSFHTADADETRQYCMRCEIGISLGQNWTGTGRQYFTDRPIFNHYEIIGLQSYRIR